MMMGRRTTAKVAQLPAGALAMLATRHRRTAQLTWVRAACGFIGLTTLALGYFAYAGALSRSPTVETIATMRAAVREVPRMVQTAAVTTPATQPRATAPQAASPTLKRPPVERAGQRPAAAAPDAPPAAPIDRRLAKFTLPLAKDLTVPAAVRRGGDAARAAAPVDAIAPPIERALQTASVVKVPPASRTGRVSRPQATRLDRPSDIAVKRTPSPPPSSRALPTAATVNVTPPVPPPPSDVAAPRPVQTASARPPQPPPAAAPSPAPRALAQPVLGTPSPSALRVAPRPVPAFLACRRQVERLARAATVWFGVNSVEIDRSQAARLAAFAKEVKGCGRFEVEVAGHADRSGADGINFALSWKRAEAVAARLETLGVPRARLRVIGLGARRPVETGGLANVKDYLVINRRVEILLR